MNRLPEQLSVQNGLFSATNSSDLVDRAFSLIELLVVIGIIGILAAITTLTYSNQQKRAREARRISDIGQVSDTIQQYISLGNNVPTTAGGWSSTEPGGPLDVLVTSGLISALPTESYPQGTTTRCRVYHYTAPANNISTSVGPSGRIGLRQYALTFHSEVVTAPSQPHPMNSSLVSLDSFNPEAACNFYSAFLLGPK